MATRGMAVFQVNGTDYTINDPNIADEFSTLNSYLKGDYVYYQGTLYVFNRDRAPGNWNSSHADQVKVTDELTKAANTDYIADEFNTYTRYQKGDFVMRNGQLYHCHTTMETAGSWTGSTNWARVTFASVIKAVSVPIASEFDIDNTYRTGDVVVHKGHFYEFTTLWRRDYWDRYDAQTQIHMFHNDPMECVLYEEKATEIENLYIVFEKAIDSRIENAMDGIQDKLDMLPNVPTTDGTYALKVTVSSGTKTFSWVAET